MTNDNTLDFAAALAARRPGRRRRRKRAEIMDFNEGRLDRGLPTVPVTYLDHVEHLDTSAHALCRLALNSTDDEDLFPLIRDDCDALIAAIDGLPRDEPTDAAQTRKLHARLAGIPPLVEALLRRLVEAGVNWTIGQEAEEAAATAERLVGRLQEFGSKDEVGEVEACGTGPLICFLLVEEQRAREAPEEGGG